jgi:hypothetical protein
MVLGWLGETAEHLQALSRSFLYDVHIRQLQRDALYAVLRAVKDDERGEAEAIQRLECSPHGRTRHGMLLLETPYEPCCYATR